jgi:hypothetical protein
MLLSIAVSTLLLAPAASSCVDFERAHLVGTWISDDGPLQGEIEYQAGYNFSRRGPGVPTANGIVRGRWSVGALALVHAYELPSDRQPAGFKPLQILKLVDCAPDRFSVREQYGDDKTVTTFHRKGTVAATPTPEAAASGIGFLWLVGPLLLVGAIGLAFLVNRRRPSAPAPTGAMAPPRPQQVRPQQPRPPAKPQPPQADIVYPCLKETSWAKLGNSLKRPLWEDESSEYMPWVAWGYDRPHTFDFLSDFHLPQLGKTLDQIAADALRNLRSRSGSWQPVNTPLEKGVTLNLLACADDFLAAERILDVVFMQQAQRRLGARGLLVGAPRREFLVAMDFESPIEATTAFVGVVAIEYHQPKSAPISPLVFVVKDGAIAGIVTAGVAVGRPSEDEEDSEAGGDPDAPTITVLTRNGANGLGDVEILAGGPRFDTLQYGVVTAMAGAVNRIGQDATFSGCITVVILPHTPKAERARLPELETHLKGVAAKATSATGRPIEVSLKIQEGQSPWAL